MTSLGIPGNMRAALLSSNWNNGTNASTFNLNLNNATSNVNQNISTHLTNFVESSSPSMVSSGIPWHLPKHNNEKPRAGRVSSRRGPRTLGRTTKKRSTMKRYGHLYERICSTENLIEAHENARKEKTWYRDVKMVDADPLFYIESIRKMLIEKTYRTSEYSVFTRFDRTKEREIFVLPYYPDRIIQWAVVQVLEPIWMNTFIGNTLSSLKGRGIHLGLSRLTKALQDRASTRYCLKLDVKKFYPSIDHEILKATIRRKIKDSDVLALLDNVIDSADGVPIGNYLSQFFGNLYLSDFDHWVKERLHVRHYYRYCDDIVILAPEKPMLHDILSKIRSYLTDKLHIRIKENYQVFPTFVRGIDFLGYRFFGNYTLLRKSTAKNMKRKLIPMLNHEALLPRDLNVIASYSGWLSWCDSYRLSRKYIQPLLAKPRLLQ